MHASSAACSALSQRPRVRLVACLGPHRGRRSRPQGPRRTNGCCPCGCASVEWFAVGPAWVAASLEPLSEHCGAACVLCRYCYCLWCAIAFGTLLVLPAVCTGPWTAAHCYALQSQKSQAPVSEFGLPGLGLVPPPGGTPSEGPWVRVGLPWGKFDPGGTSGWPEVPLSVTRGGP